MEQILRKLVAYPTLTGDHQAAEQAFEYIDEFLSTRGMNVTRKHYDDFGSLVATTRHTKTPAVMLCGHIDVVPAATDDDFHLTEKDGKWYGRGVLDMKGAIAAYLQLVDELGAGIAAYDFGIMITSDEENRAQSAGHLAEEGYLPKAVVLPDGGHDWQLEAKCKGAWLFEVSVDGKSAHGSRPWLGESASFKLIELLGEVKSLFQGHGPDTSTLNIGHFKSGTTINQIPDHAQAGIDIRFMNAEDRERISARVKAICDSYGATIKTHFNEPVIVHDLTNPFIAKYAAAIKRVTGVESRGVISYGGNETTHFESRGIPCAVAYPPGAGHHSRNEWVDKAALLQFPQVLRVYLDSTAKFPRRRS
jgi:succinyl-diaminopimelate desuccinylase